MTNGEKPASEQNGDLSPQKTEAIRPRRSQHSGRAVKKVHREHRGQSPFIFWMSMIGLLAVYMILFVAVRWHQRAQFRHPPAAATVAEPAATDVLATAETAVHLKEQILTLISRVQETALAIETATKVSETGDPNAAVVPLRQQLEKDTESFPLKLSLAKLLLEQGQRVDAIGLLTDALETNPGHEEARLLLARALLEEQAYEEAGKVAEWILSENDYSVEAHDIASGAFMMGGRPAEAIPHLRRMTALVPDSLTFQNRLAQAHMRAGEYDKALQLFQSVMGTDPENSVTFYNLSACYALQNMPEQSAQTLNEALKLFDSSFVTAWLQGPDFDAVRTNTVFVALFKGMSKASGN